MNRTQLTREHEASFNRIVRGAVLLPIGVMIVASVFLAWFVGHLLNVTDWVDHTDRVIAKANHAERLILDMQTEMRGFLINADPQLLKSCNQISNQIPSALDELANEVRDNPPQVDRVNELRLDFHRWAQYAGTLVERRKHGTDYQSLAVNAQELALMRPVRAGFDQFVEVENGLRVKRSTVVEGIETKTRNVRWIVLIILGLGIAFYVRQQLRAVAKLYDAALRGEEDKSRALQASETSLRQAEAKLRSYAEDLEKTVAKRTAELRETIGELEAYSYSVSHDLRAPLRAVRGYAQVLTEDFGDKAGPEVKDYLHRMMTSCDRMDSLIQDVLSYSRLSRADIQSHPVDLERLVPEIIQQYPALQAAKEHIHVEHPLPKLNAPEALLSQCISNLLNNAVKFTKPGERPDVRVWAETKGKDACIFVEDKGIGIAPEYQDRIFGVFERIAAAKTYEGTGIGLAIVRKAIERMGGKVGVTSELGKGSRFWLDLPGRVL